MNTNPKLLPAMCARESLGQRRVKVNNEELRTLLESGLSMFAVGEKLGISSATVCRRARLVAA
jgi:hypothetical protein